MFGTRLKFRHFCPTLFCPIRYEVSLRIQSENTFHTVVVIARCWVQCEKYFPSFLYFAISFKSLKAIESIAECEKWGKYSPLMHETTCGNYSIVKCLLAYKKFLTCLLHRVCLIQRNTNLILTKWRKTANTNFTYLLHYKILYSIQFFAFDLFSNVLYSLECLIFLNIRSNLKASNLDSVKLSQS